MNIDEIINETILSFLSESIRMSKLDFFDVEDDVLNKIPNNKLYHGSNNISWFKNILDIDTYNNTVNATSKYLFLSPHKRVALNYSDSGYGMEVNFETNSGVIVFGLKGGRHIKLKPIDFKNNIGFEALLDKYSDLGYDYLIIPDGDTHVILNNSVLNYYGSYYNTKK